MARQSVEERREDGIRQIDPLQERRRLGIEQPAIVGRQTERGLALVDRTEQPAQPAIVGAHRGGEGVVLAYTIGDLVPDRTETVVVVAHIVDRQEVAILGIEHEQQAVEQGQRRFLQLAQIGAGARCGTMRVGCIQRRDDIGEKPDEHEVGKVARDPLLPVPPLIEGEQVEATAIGPQLDERGAAEHERENAEPVVARALVALGQQVGERGSIDQARQVDLEIFLQARLGALVVEPPQPAVGENAPLNAPVGERLGARQVAKHLARWHLALDVALPCALGGAVKRAVPALVLDDRDAVTEPRVLPGLGERARLRGRIREQKHVGNVGAALARGSGLHQPQIPVPADRFQDAEDQVLLGLCLIR